MHTLGADRPSYAWDRAAAPALQVAPGDVVELEVRDAADGQLSPTATLADVADLDPRRANPLTGPVAVAGARPGDVLVVEVLDVDVGGWGWSAVIPGFGLLRDDFPDPHLVLSGIGTEGVAFGDTGLVLPHRPFIGTIGVAPDRPGPHPTIPPLATGGNMDCRDVRPGAVLRLPVQVAGGLLSVGDTHAVQGDGEVCGTAVETRATVRLRLGLERGRSLSMPELTIPADRVPLGARHATLGIGPDLHAAARDATRAMVAWLVDVHGFVPVDAYVLCSVVADLRIREVVDEPNWVVSLDLPLDVLTGWASGDAVSGRAPGPSPR